MILSTFTVNGYTTKADRTIHLLKKSGWLMPRYEKAIRDRQEFADNIITALVKIRGIYGLLRQSIVEVIVYDPEHANEFAFAVSALSKVRTGTPENLQVIIDNPKYALNICSAFSILDKNKLLKPRIRRVIVHNPEYASDICGALIALYNKKLLRPDLRNLILRKPKYASDIRRLAQLANSVLSISSIRKVIVHNPEYASDIYKLGSLLPDLELLTPSIIEVIAGDPGCVCDIYAKLFALRNNGLLIAEKIAEAFKEAMFTCQSDLNNGNTPSRHSQFFVPVAHTQQVHSNQQESLLGQNTDATAYNNGNSPSRHGCVAKFY